MRVSSSNGRCFRMRESWDIEYIAKKTLTIKCSFLMTSYRRASVHTSTKTPFQEGRIFTPWAS